MGRYAVVNKATGVVENCILWDGETNWSPPAGFEAVEVDRTVGPSMVRQADGTFKSIEVPPVPAKPTIEEQLATIVAKLDAQDKAIDELKAKVR